MKSFLPWCFPTRRTNEQEHFHRERDNSGELFYQRTLNGQRVEHWLSAFILSTMLSMGQRQSLLKPIKVICPSQSSSQSWSTALRPTHTQLETRAFLKNVSSVYTPSLVSLWIRSKGTFICSKGTLTRGKHTLTHRHPVSLWDIHNPPSVRATL